MIRGNKTQLNSGAVGDPRGVVQNVATCQDREMITDGSDYSKWTVLNDDTANLTEHANHIIGTRSIEFDKVDGAGNTLYSGIYRADLDLDLSRFLADDLLMAYFYVSAKTNLVSVNIRLGTDASNYSEWSLLAASITAAVWQEFKKALKDVTIGVTGNGCNLAAVKYACFVVVWTAETNTLADIRLDSIYMKSIAPAS